MYLPDFATDLDNCGGATPAIERLDHEPGKILLGQHEA
jgi:hypothetical protein